MKRGKKANKEPQAKIYGPNVRNATINKAALALLTQDGETHVEVYVKEGKVYLKPIKPTYATTLKIGDYNSGSRAHLAIGHWLSKQGYGGAGDTFRMIWNDEKGWVELEKVEKVKEDATDVTE